MPTMRRPVDSAHASRRESGAGMLAAPGNIIPMTSTRLVMVEAVPIVLHVPGLRE